MAPRTTRTKRTLVTRPMKRKPAAAPKPQRRPYCNVSRRLELDDKGKEKATGKVPPRTKHDDICAAARVATPAVVAAAFGCTETNVRSHLARERAYHSDSPPARPGVKEKFDERQKRRIKRVMLANPWPIERDMLALLAEKGFDMSPKLFRRLRSDFGLHRRVAQTAPARPRKAT